MLASIEIKNFQSHKDTKIDFSKGINSVCGESDNGKTAVIRAVKWVVENRPLGTDKLNSSWNKGFKENMSVKMVLSNGDWVERVRGKDRNGYSYCEGGKVVDLNATGTDVPQKVKDILRLGDVNFQFQLDSPYLLSLPASEASRYLNRIIHLDSIDRLLSEADSDKRRISAERKVVEKDIKECASELESLSWVAEAEAIQKRIDKYSQLLEISASDMAALSSDLEKVADCQSSIADFSEQKALAGEIEKIELFSTSELERDLASFEDCQKSVFDFSKQKVLIRKIEEMELFSVSELENEIFKMEGLLADVEDCESDAERLRESLPKVCPLCGSPLCGEDAHVQE